MRCLCPESLSGTPGSHHYPLPEEYAVTLIRLFLASLLTLACTSLVAAQSSQDDDLVRKAVEHALIGQQPTSQQVNVSIPAKRKFDHKIKIKTDYDKFSDSTDVQMMHTEVYNKLGRKISMNALYSYPGHTPSKPRVVTLAFNSTSPEWQFLRERDLTILAGSRKAGPGRMELINTRIEDSGRVTETVSMDIPVNDFLFAINSGTVEIQLSGFGVAEFSLSYPQLEALRDFASRMQP
jgi:hypothetical protein